MLELHQILYKQIASDEADLISRRPFVVTDLQGQFKTVSKYVVPVLHATIDGIPAPITIIHISFANFTSENPIEVHFTISNRIIPLSPICYSFFKFAALRHVKVRATIQLCHVFESFIIRTCKVTFAEITEKPISAYYNIILQPQGPY